MQTIPGFQLLRRVLFPYSGEDALTFKQGLRVILAWMLLLPLLISLLAAGVAALEGSSMSRIVQMFVFALISGACIFGLLGLLVVWVNNRSARIRRAWRDRRGW
jgi:Na+/H+-dicarboxylate symporter